MLQSYVERKREIDNLHGTESITLSWSRSIICTATSLLSTILRILEIIQAVQMLGGISTFAWQHFFKLFFNLTCLANMSGTKMMKSQFLSIPPPHRLGYSLYVIWKPINWCTARRSTYFRDECFSCVLAGYGLLCVYGFYLRNKLFLPFQSRPDIIKALASYRYS